MTLPLDNNAEGGSNGTGVTAASSGGASGTAFDTVSLGTAAINFSSTQKAHGGLAYAIVQPASVSTAYLSWSTALGTVTSIFGRVYVWIPSNPTTASFLLNFFSGATRSAGFRINNDGTIQVTNGTGVLGTASASSLTTSTWMRIEFSYTFSTTAGAATLNVYTGDSTSLFTSASVSGQAFAAANATDARFGSPVASGTPSSTFYLDDIDLNSTGFPGPVVSRTVPMASRYRTRALPQSSRPRSLSVPLQDTAPQWRAPDAPPLSHARLSALTTRGKRTFPVQPQVPVPIKSAGNRSPATKRTASAARGRQWLAPVQAPLVTLKWPTPKLGAARRLLSGVARGKRTLAPNDQGLTVRTSPKRPQVGIRRGRASRWTPVQEVSLRAAQTTRNRFASVRRGRQVNPVPTQAVVTSPSWVPSRITPRKVLSAAQRGRRTLPTTAQITVPKLVPSNRAPKLRRGFTVRGRRFNLPWPLSAILPHVLLPTNVVLDAHATTLSLDAHTNSATLNAHVSDVTLDTHMTDAPLNAHKLDATLNAHTLDIVLTDRHTDLALDD